MKKWIKFLKGKSNRLSPDEIWDKYAPNSLYLFSLENRFRLAWIHLIEMVWFDRCILILILLNSLFLAMNDYDFRNPNGKESWRNDLVNESEIIFLVLFTLECLTKTVAMGFVVGKSTYLRDPWNWLDFIVVLVGWIGLLPGVANLTALRAIRVLRPLRSVNQLPELKSIVSTLLNSIPFLANVAFFLLFVFTVFGIIGVTFLKGLYY